MRPGRDVEHPPPFSAEVKKRVELRLYPLWDFMTFYREIFIFLTVAWSGSFADICLVSCLEDHQSEREGGS